MTICFYFRDCFLALVSHKFRGLLGRTRVLHGGIERPVLVAFSGSSSSLTLLHLFQDATAADLGHRRLMAAPRIIYIEGKYMVLITLLYRKH